MVTGALHDDGLTDTADGLGGGRDRDHALAIMKDSRIGSYGGVALILSFALRATALAALFRLIGPLQIGLSFLAIAAIARMGLVWHWTLLPPAKKDGVASSVGEPESDAAFAAYVTGALVALSVLLFSVPFKAIIFCGLAVAFVVYSFSRYVRYRIGGHTGDTLGASLQLAEITAVSALALLA